MLFELADDLLTDLTNEETLALDLILHARRLGYHLLLGSEELFSSLHHFVDLSPSARAIFGRARRRQVQKAGLRGAVNHMVRISREIGPQVDNLDGVTILTLRLSHFRELWAPANAVVLGENLKDAKLAKEMAKVYAYLQGLQRVKLSCRLDGGGGSTTVDTFCNYREDPRLCICIVDKDADAPEGPNGQTAKSLLREVSPQKPWAKVVTTRCREAENALSAPLMEYAVRGDAQLVGRVQQVERLEKTAASLRDYCDFKKGTTLEWVFSLAEGPIRRYWLGYVPALAGLPQVRSGCISQSKCLAPDQCTCCIAPRFNDILTSCLRVLQEMPTHKVSEALCDTTRPHWRYVGRTVFSWACGTEPIYS